MNGRAGLTVVAVIVGVTAVMAAASADVTTNLNSFVYDSGDSVWEYTYEIDNSGGSDYVYEFELDPVDMATITGFPSGWDDTFAITSVGGVVSWSAPSTSDWVAPGSTLSGFVIESPYGSASGYTMWGAYTDADGSSGGTTAFSDGLIDGPRIPEPGTLLLLGCGVVAVAARRRRREG